MLSPFTLHCCCPSFSYPPLHTHFAIRDNDQRAKYDHFGYTVSMSISGNSLAITSAPPEATGKGSDSERLELNGVFLSSTALTLAAKTSSISVTIWQRPSLSTHFSDVSQQSLSSFGWASIAYPLEASTMSYDGHSVVSGDPDYIISVGYCNYHYFQDHGYWAGSWKLEVIVPLR
mmetsp:Transcript_33851/g.86882  ORF Transcript_33851/g.86882 Transcript_33851/m.86882 type:complete len:175 (-) Transcript_33851:131-655(-)